MPDSKLELVPGTLDMLVMKTLASGALHGYSIARRLQQVSADVLRVEEGSLYPALHRMERRGWIEAEWGVSDANRRAKYYRLTTSGRKQLKEQAADWARLSNAIAQVLEPQPKGA